MKKYITYGKGNKLDINKLPPLSELDLRPNGINKVYRTLWGSPVDAEYGWKAWCLDNEFNLEALSENNSFCWTLKPTARILTISNEDDLAKVPFTRNKMALLHNPDYFSTYIDYYKIVAKSYDAVELEDGVIGHRFSSPEEICFNSWDCESIMVLNRDAIVPCED